MEFKLLPLVIVLSFTLIGCGGGDDEAPTVTPPDVEKPELPLIPVLPSTPLPTTPCEDGSCLEDNGFTNPNLPTTDLKPSTPLPSTPCEDGSCLEDDYLVTALQETILRMSNDFNWDTESLTTLCSNDHHYSDTVVSCYYDEKGLPVFKVTNSSSKSVAIYSPKSSINRITAAVDMHWDENIYSSIKDFSCNANTCNPIQLGDSKFVYIAHTPTLKESEDSALNGYGFTSYMTFTYNLITDLGNQQWSNGFPPYLSYNTTIENIMHQELINTP
ncbi:hypothetical protein [Photobacterium leiognathi]|uniref:hypothetical protein n=1 Tax=Photobacterium leiognathi TaxID=553611 RepID=UPI0029823BB3|nr:hypothetical protein [Photobacterium leiognathi]